MKAISSFVLETTLIASIFLAFMATGALADEQSDKRKSDASLAVDYLFGLTSAKIPEDIIIEKYEDEFKRKAKQFRKYNARLLEKAVEYDRRDDLVWMHLVFTRTKEAPDMWVVLTAYFMNDQIDSIEMVTTLKETPNKAF